MKAPVEVEVAGRQFQVPRWLIALGVVVLLGAGGVAAVQIAKSDLKSYSDQQEDDLETYSDGNRAAIEEAMVAVCEIQKSDRIDSARAWTQAEKTWLTRSLDNSLPPSERELAAETATVYAESANQLRARLFLCEPLIRERQQVIDDRALREAQGRL